MSKFAKCQRRQIVTNATQPAHCAERVKRSIPGKFQFTVRIRSPTEINKNTASIAVFLFIPGRGERIRTFDILVPNQALYQTELHPETTAIITAFFINANFSFIFISIFISYKQ